MKKGVKERVYKNTYLIAIKIPAVFDTTKCHPTILLEMCKVLVAFAESPCLAMEDTLGKPTMLSSNTWAAAVTPLPQLRTVSVSELQQQPVERELNFTPSTDLHCHGDKLPGHLQQGCCYTALCVLSCSSAANSSVGLKHYSAGPAPLASKLTVEYSRAQLQATTAESLIAWSSVQGFAKGRLENITFLLFAFPLTPLLPSSVKVCAYCLQSQHSRWKRRVCAQTASPLLPLCLERQNYRHPGSSGLRLKRNKAF